MLRVNGTPRTAVPARAMSLAEQGINEKNVLKSMPRLGRRPLLKNRAGTAVACKAPRSLRAADRDRSLPQYLVQQRSAERCSHRTLDAPAAPPEQFRPHRRRSLSIDGQRAERNAGARSIVSLGVSYTLRL